MTTQTHDVRSTPFQVLIADMPAVMVSIDAVTARRKVSGWAGNVSTSCGAGTPALVIAPTQVFWRVPVIFTHGRIGYVGDVGSCGC